MFWRVTGTESTGDRSLKDTGAYNLFHRLYAHICAHSILMSCSQHCPPISSDHSIPKQ